MGANSILYGVDMPGFLRLHVFARLCQDAFGGYGTYHVGSSLSRKDWRDVDVRLIMADEDFKKMFGEELEPNRLDGKWAAMCMAFSALGKDLTGLPIDFQIQPQTLANAKYGKPDHQRNYIGIHDFGGKGHDEIAEAKTKPDRDIAPWSSQCVIMPEAEGRIWVRFCGSDFIYRWLHPTENRWVEEPEQIGMPLFSSSSEAKAAADRSPMPPTWEAAKP